MAGRYRGVSLFESSFSFTNSRVSDVTVLVAHPNPRHAFRRIEERPGVQVGDRAQQGSDFTQEKCRERSSVP